MTIGPRSPCYYRDVRPNEWKHGSWKASISCPGSRFDVLVRYRRNTDSSSLQLPHSTSTIWSDQDPRTNPSRRSLPVSVYVPVHLRPQLRLIDSNSYQMLAGDTNRRSFNSSSFADKAIDFVCLGRYIRSDQRTFALTIESLPHRFEGGPCRRPRLG